MRSKVMYQVLLLSIVAGLVGVVPSSAAGTCSTTPNAGGDWAQHGGDLLGTRSQASENTISTENVGNLANKWTFDVTQAGGAGTIQTIPVVGEGCVFVQTSSGGNWIFALNADTGELVWSRELRSGGCHNAPVVRNGILYVNEPTQFAAGVPGPHLLALDAQTGVQLWEGESVASEPSTGANAGCAAPVALLGDVALIGITNGEFDGLRNGGYAVVDATDGHMISRHYIVPDEEAALGYAGCSLWSGWSIDPVTKHAYTGTAQPSAWTGLESDRCNALIKIDLDPTSPTFGEIVGSLKGTYDEPPYIDVDFGSAPTVVRDSSGRQVVAALQKSGYLHGGFTSDMAHAWTTPVSPLGIATGNHTASASDGRNIFTVGAFPGQIYSINSDTGLPNWVTPVISPIASNSVAYANGVVYYGDEKAFLNAYDASNGLPLLARPIAADVSGCTRNGSGGVSIARNKVIMACGPVIAAYGL